MTYWPDADATELVKDDARPDLQWILKIPAALV
jgi:hypothetical protein